jgi:hypothetical protein
MIKMFNLLIDLTAMNLAKQFYSEERMTTTIWKMVKCRGRVIPNQRQNHQQQHQHAIPHQQHHPITASKEKEDKAVIEFNCTGRRNRRSVPVVQQQVRNPSPATSKTSADRDDER